MSENRFKRYDDRETLERIKRWSVLVYRFSHVRIYSGEWQLYWRGEGRGYTSNPAESKIWLCKDAFAKTRHCGPEKHIQYIKALEQSQ